MKFNVLTIFPEIINDYSSQSILGRAQKSGAIKIEANDFRKFTTDKRGHVDDSPYGGGPGMVLQAQPIYDCLKSLGLVKNGKKLKIENRKLKIIALDPAGKKFDQKMAKQFSKLDNLILIAGRYEGFDARIYKFVDQRVSVGDYVLAGGELPALTIVEAVSRLVPGVLGNPESLKEETFAKVVGSKEYGVGDKNKINHSLQPTTYSLKKEYPQYTRPENFMGLKVPKVLLSGDHKKIEEWRKGKTKN